MATPTDAERERAERWLEEHASDPCEATRRRLVLALIAEIRAEVRERTKGLAELVLREVVDSMARMPMLREAIARETQQAVAEEREACARVVKTWYERELWDEGVDDSGESKISAAIRARGQG